MTTNRFFVPSRDWCLNQRPFVGILAETGEMKKTLRSGFKEGEKYGRSNH